MAMPAVTADLINLALLKLKQAPITSIEDTNSPAAIAGLLCFDLARQSLLRNYNFNFSRKRGYALLVPDVTPAFDYEYYYSWPADCLKVARVGLRGEAPRPFDIEGRQILVNPTRYATTSGGEPELKLPIQYMRDVTNPTEWDPLFTDCFVLEMAVRLCPPIVGDKAREEELKKEQLMKLREAVSINSQERPLEITDIDPITEARWDGFSGRDMKIDKSYFDG